MKNIFQTYARSLDPTRKVYRVEFKIHLSHTYNLDQKIEHVGINMIGAQVRVPNKKDQFAKLDFKLGRLLANYELGKLDMDMDSENFLQFIPSASVRADLEAFIEACTIEKRAIEHCPCDNCCHEKRIQKTYAADAN